MKIKFSLYNDQTTDELFVTFKEKYGSKLNEKALKKLSKQIYDTFFEINFDVEVSESGKIEDFNLKK